MSSALQSSSKDAGISKKKIALKNEDTTQMLQKLLLRPNIIIKKTSIEENFKTTLVSGKSIAPLHDLETPSLESPNPKDVAKTGSFIKKVDQSRSLLISENPEYYPDRHKRIIPPKKKALQPKCVYKVIATTNKRKRSIPKKELTPLPAKQLEPEPELSLSDLVRMVEDEGLDDEDFMEILTCPSPVWWEERSDEDETSIDLAEIYNADIKHETEDPTVNNTKDKVNANAEKQLTSGNLAGGSLKSDINFFKKFVKKRSKLESVLGNIKRTKTRVNKNSREDDENKKYESTSASPDISLNGKELANILESIEIPVRDIDGTNVEATKVKNMTEAKANNQSNALLTEESEKKSRSKRKRKFKNFTRVKNKGKKRKIAKENNVILNERDTGMVPIDLPPLTKNPFLLFPDKSPNSIDRVISGSTNSKTVEFDSISDTNVRFLDEYLDEVDLEKYNKKKCKEKDLVTVYKIVGNQTDNVDVEEQIKVNLVDKSNGKKFYNKRKKSYRTGNSCVK